MKVYEAKIIYRKVGEPITTNEATFDGPEKPYKYLKASGLIEEYQEQEQFFVFLLNRKNRIKGVCRVSIGTASSALVHPREVFRPAVMESASAIIVAHNHPSGDPAPSSADIRITRQLKEAAGVLGIDLLDHVIVGEPEHTSNGSGFYSFNDNGLI